MRLKTLSLIVLLSAVTCAIAADVVGGRPKQYRMKMDIIEMREGKPVTLARPMLLAEDGKAASLLVGGEMPVDLGQREYIEFGQRAEIIVHEMAPDQWRISARFSFTSVDKEKAGTIIIPESAVRIIKAIKPGDTLEADLPGPHQQHVKLTVTEVTP